MEKIIHSNGAFFNQMFANCVHVKRCLPSAFTLNDVCQVRSRLNDVCQFYSRLGKFFENPKMFDWKRRMQF